jgi:hypothetical protein
VAPDLAAGGAGIAHHSRQDVGVEHPVHRDMVGRSIEPGYGAHGFNQRLAVMRPGAADQRAVDIKQNQC